MCPLTWPVGSSPIRVRLITFEVLLRDFALHDPALARISELVRCIDVQEGVLPEDAALLKTLLDGLIALTADDHQLLERARLLFEALYSGMQGDNIEERTL